MIFMLLITFLTSGCSLFSNTPAAHNATFIETTADEGKTAVSTIPTVATVQSSFIETTIETTTSYCKESVQESDNEGRVVPEYSLQIINSYPHDSNAFTQGLVFRNGQFYESTGLRGQSTIRLVDIETGTVQQQRTLEASEFGEGTTLFNDKLYQLTWQSNIGYIYKLDTFELLGTFSYSGEGWGLTSDSQCLIMSNGSSEITYRDPETFTILRSITVKDGEKSINQLNELEYINGEIWANIWNSPLIVRIDPLTGQVLGWLDGSPLVEIVQPRNSEAVFNGIAYDGENGRIYLTGKLWQTVFEIQLIQK